jgi:nicotinamide riboside kinase
MSRIRVGISGSAGIGKTTLAKQLAEYFHVKYITEGVREYLAETGLTLRQALADAENFQWEIWQRHLGQINSCYSFISDRSFADFISYAILVSGGYEWVNEYVQYITEYVGDYDLILVLPFGKIELVADGVRSVDVKYQKTVHACISFFALRYGKKVMFLTGAPEQYFDEAVQTIKTNLL